jgi:hypothetical protein
VVRTAVAVRQFWRQRQHVTLLQQKGDIQKAGLQAAYEQAQNLYGTEAQRALAAQQAQETVASVRRRA